MKIGDVPGLVDYSIDRYAGAIINGRPEEFDAIEIQGIRSYQTGADSFAYEVDNHNPEAYSTYLHCKEAGVECCGDFTLREHALEYARELSALHGWPINDYTHEAKGDKSKKIEGC